MKKYGLIGALVAGLTTPAFGIPITVLVNSNGTFSPPTREINEGDTVVFRGNGFDFKNTDAIVQIAGPNVAHTLAQICGSVSGGPVTPVVTGSELYGPKRKGVSGIHVLGPQGNGFIETNTANQAATCESIYDPGNAPGVEFYDVAREIDPVTNRLHLLCKKQVGGLPASEGNQGRISQVTQSVWNNPDIDGVVLRIRWTDFQYDDGSAVVTVWTDIDREVREAIKRGKIISINVHAGEDTPGFIFNDYDRDPVAPGLQKLPSSNVQPVFVRDYGSDPVPPPGCGTPLKLGSPADANYLSKIQGLYQAVAAHFKADARFFQALGYVKVSGLNLTTGEARLPKRCLDPGVAGQSQCVCNTQRWATSVNAYTPTKLYTYYNQVENQILTSFLGQKSLHYMLIHDGFPEVLDANNYYRDPGLGAVGAGWPTGVQQTVQILEYGRNGRFAASGDPAGLANDTATGKLFVSQHSGLQLLPRDQDPNNLDCAQNAAHGLPVVDAFGKAYFAYYSGGLPLAGGHGGYDGCPNWWAAQEGYRDQIIGYQTQNSVAEPYQVDSSLWNMTANSNAVYYEIYEDAAWRIGRRLGTGPAAAVLDAAIGYYPTTFGAAYQKNLHRWGQQLHARREAIATHLAAYPNAADPFPVEYSHTFNAPLNVNQATAYFFIDPARCSSAPVNQAAGIILVHGL